MNDRATTPFLPARPRAGAAEAILDHLPFGILHLDRDGHAQAWNPAADALVGPGLRRGRRCCELFGCGSGSGVLSDDCLTDLVRASQDALPEIRVDLPGRDDDAGALWLTGAPMSGTEDGSIVQVRPADRRDRRRRTDPHWLTGPRLRVNALGRTEVLSDETALGGRWLAQRPGQLLKFLVSQRTRSVQLDEIAHGLWPESGFEAQSRVRHTMHKLRRCLEPDRANRAPSQFIVTREGTYALDPDRVVVDADEFERLARAGLADLGADAPRARDRLERATALYNGDFLADEPYAEWALDERDRLRYLATCSLHALADMDHRIGDLESAYAHLRRLAELEPLDIHVQRDLLSLCLRRGRRTEATRRFNALRRRTMRELGHEPGFLLTELAGEVLAGPPGRAEPLDVAERGRRRA
jgi:DNA-binding SARP family transcriptional activator